MKLVSMTDILLSVFLLGLLATPVLSAGSSSLGSGCVTNYDNTQNYFPFAYNSTEPFALPVGQTIVNTALDFTVQYQNNYKMVRDNYSNVEFLLYQCGTPKPTGVNASVNSFIIPLTSVAIDETVPVTFFELLGLLPVVAEASSDNTISQVTSPCFQKLVNTQVISPSTPSFLGAVVTAAPGASNKTNYINFDASFDPGPLKRAEWIKYLALFFNREADAATIYGQIESNYQCLNGSNVLTNKPTVAWLSFYGSNWTVSTAAYKYQLVSDAGGANPSFTSTQMYNVSVLDQAAAFQKFLQSVDIVIDESYAILYSAYNMSTFTTNLGIATPSTLPFVANHRVWRFDRRLNPAESGLDWFEGAIAQPQIVVQEFLGILNPNYTHQHYFFRNVALAEKVVHLSGANCTGDLKAALQPTIFACPSKPATPTSPLASNPTPTTTPAPSPASGAAVVVPTTLAVIATLFAGLYSVV